MTEEERRFAIACELRAVALAEALAAAINQAPHWRNNGRELLRQIREWEPPPTIVQLARPLNRSPSSLDEQHMAAWNLKRELHR